MPKSDKQDLVEAISLRLTNAPTNSQRVNLADEDMKHFSGVDPIYNSLKRIFGDRVAKRELDGARIRIYIEPDETSDSPYGLEEFHHGLKLTAKELKANANSTDQKRHSVALKNPALVPVLQALSRAKSTHGLDVAIEFNGASHAAPDLRPLDFAEPDADHELRKSGSFHVRGLLRDDFRGHQLIVTDNQLRVHLPPDSPKWHWASVRDVLESSTHLVATLRRKTKGEMWTVGDDAGLTRQQDLPELEAQSS